MKRIFLVLIYLLVNSLIFSQTTLSPGDIAFTGVNMDNPDQYSIVFLVDIESGTVIKFTDNGWKSDNTWRGNEGVQTWTADRAYSKGEEIVIDADGPSLSGSGDQVIAYQNDHDMITAINDEGHHVWQSDATDANTSALPLGLENGTNCVALEETDNIKYNRTLTSGTKEELLNAINDYSNWSGSNSTPQTLSSDGFTVDDGTLPVELSSFNVFQISGNSAKIQWVVQSETNLLGYNIFKNTDPDFQTSQKINATIINANNTPVTTKYEFNDDDINNLTECYYWLQSVEMTGESKRYEPVHFIYQSSNPEQNNHQDEICPTKLNMNFPNPFNPETTISFTLNESKETEVDIYNIRGELVKNLYQGIANKGLNRINWNGKDNNYKQVAGGIYFYKMKTDNYYAIRKMILLK